MFLQATNLYGPVLLLIYFLFIAVIGLVLFFGIKYLIKWLVRIVVKEVKEELKKESKKNERNT